LSKELFLVICGLDSIVTREEKHTSQKYRQQTAVVVLQ